MIDAAVYLATCFTLLHGVRVIALFVASGDRVLPRIRDHVLCGDVTITRVWAGLGDILDRIYGNRIFGTRALIISATTSVLIFLFFWIMVILIFENPSGIEVIQYIVAAFILNVVGDSLSLSQTRVLLRFMERSYSDKMSMILLILDIIASVCIFIFLYFVTIRINMWVVYSNENWWSVFVRSFQYNIGMENEVSAFFLWLSLGSCLISTIIHFYYYISINVYGFLVRRWYSDEQISKDVAGHFANGVVFFSVILMAWGFISLLY